MNFRSLKRGDGVVIAAAVLLFIASFLDYYSSSGYGAGNINAWDMLGTGIGIYMGGVIGAALIVINRCLPQPRKVAGLDLGQLGTSTTIVVVWASFWTILDVPDGVDAGAGLILGFIASLALAGAAVATPLVPGLSAPLAAAQHPGVPYGGVPPQQGGYGYPGGPQPSYGGQQPFAGQPAQQTQGGQPSGDFSPFWFAVPVQRPLYAEDGSSNQIAELAPGTWYLAVEQRGTHLVAQTQDGRRGVLQDTSGIQRG